MFDVRLIKQGLSGLVGFRQPANPAFAVVDTENQASVSGLFVTDNPYAKIEYLKANSDYAKISDEDFNKMLKNIRETSVMNVCNQVFNEPDFIDRNLVYSNTLNKVETEQLPVGFIGYKIVLDSKKNIAFRINKAILELSTSGNMDLLVYNSSLKEPIFTHSITYTDYYNVEEVDIMVNDLGFHKGTFYVGFLSDGSLETYKRSYLDSNLKNSITCMDIHSIYVPEHTSTDLFDQTKVRDYANYIGLNLDITIIDDHTDFILTNKYLFSRAIYIDAIISCLNIYAASLRRNMNQMNSDELYSRIMLEIEGTRPDDNVIHIRGLRPEMLYEISQIREQLLKLKQGFVGKYIMIETQD